MDKRGCPDDRQLQAMLEGRLGEAQQSETERHLDRCPDCQRRLEIVADPATLRPASPCPAYVKESTRSKWLSAVIDGLRHATSRGALSTLHSRSPARSDRFSFLEPSPRPEAIGRLGPYDVTDVVGQGGMGIVFRAFDSSLDRTVALKVLLPELAADEGARQRFIREAKMAASIDHENVVTIHAVQESKGVQFLVMQFVEGESLADRLDRCGRLDVVQVTSLAWQLAAGLAAAHARGMVHRDIKPANLLFEKDTDRVKITDFGLAKVVDDTSLTRTGILAGTPEYMSPEQAEGHRVDHRSDLFSVAVVLFTAIAGRSPFRGDSLLATLKRICNDQPPPLQDANLQVPDWLADLIDRLMRKDPDQRIQSALEVQQILQEQGATASSRQNLAPARPSPVTREEGGKKRSRALITLASVALTLLLVALSLSVTEMIGLTHFVGNRQQDETPPGVAAAMATPIERGFYLRGKKEAYQVLADAVAAADDGEVIEVYADDQLSTLPVRISGKALTIRAADGNRPTITIPDGRPSSQPAITTDSLLVLEGLEFKWQMTSGSFDSTRLNRSAILVDGGSLWLANCRFSVAEDMACIGLHGAVGQLRNCELIAEKGVCLAWQPTGDAHLESHHCVFRGRVGITMIPSVTARNQTPTRVQLVRNTITTERALQFFVAPSQIRRVDINAERNIFDVSQVCMLSGQREPSGLRRNMPDDALVSDFLQRIVQWRERANVYSASASFVAFRIVGHTTGVRPAGPRKLADWLTYWGLSETGSTVTDTLERLSIDAGADIRFVGAGKAFQRWKQTDEYVQWLARTRAKKK